MKESLLGVLAAPEIDDCLADLLRKGGHLEKKTALVYHHHHHHDGDEMLLSQQEQQQQQHYQIKIYKNITYRHMHNSPCAL